MKSEGFQGEIGTEANPVQLSDAEEDALEALAERESRSHVLNRKRKWACGSSSLPRSRQRGHSGKFTNEKPLPPGAAVGWESEEEGSGGDRERSRAEVDYQNDYALPGFRAGEGHLEEEVAESTGRDDDQEAADEEYEDSDEDAEVDDELAGNQEDDDEDFLMWEAGTSSRQWPDETRRGSSDEALNGAHGQSSHDSRNAHPPTFHAHEEEESTSSDIAVVGANEEDEARREWEAAAQRRRAVHIPSSKKPEVHSGEGPRVGQTACASVGPSERLPSIRDPLPQVHRAPAGGSGEDGHVPRGPIREQHYASCAKPTEQVREVPGAGLGGPENPVRPAGVDPAAVQSSGEERFEFEDGNGDDAGEKFCGTSRLDEDAGEGMDAEKGDEANACNGVFGRDSNGVVLADEEGHRGAAGLAPMEDSSKENGGDPMDACKAVLIGGREMLKRSEDFKKAEEEEWQRRHEELQRQALAVQLERKRRRKENEVNARMQQRLEEVRSFQAAEEVKLATREDMKSRVRAELERKIEGCYCMGDVLHRLEINVANWPNASLEQVRDAFRKALLQFHPDHASTAKGLDHSEQVHAEEKFKLITSMRNKLPWVAPLFRIY